MRPRVLIALLTVSLLAGCAGDSGSGDDAPSKDGGAGAATAEAPPRLLTLREVRAQPAGSAARAVLTLWYWAQWGSSPLIAASYHPEVLATVGTPNLIETYAQQRSVMMHERPKVVETVDTASGTFVGLSVARSDGPTSFESYYLQRREGGWVIAHDTFFERALAGYIQSTVQSTIDPDAKEPAPRAVRAGQRAAKQFRAMFSPAGAPTG